MFNVNVCGDGRRIDYFYRLVSIIHQPVARLADNANAYRRRSRMPNVFQPHDALAIAHYRPRLLAILLSSLPNRASLCYL